MIKEMKYGAEARKNMAEGIHQICRILLGTYGPLGQNVIMDDEKGNLLLSAQASSVLMNHKSKDLFIDEGVQLAKEAVLNTQQYVGDGSVLTAVLMDAMVKKGEQYISAGYNPVTMGKGLKKILPLIEKELDLIGEPIAMERLKKSLYLELEDAELMDLVTKAYEQVGMEGIVLVKEGNGLSTELQLTEGMELSGGYLSPKMCLSGYGGTVSLQQPYILIVEGIIQKFSDLLPILQKVMDKNGELLIIADDIVGEALTLLNMNIQKKVFRAIAVKSVGIGKRKTDLLHDLACYTGGIVLDQENPVKLSNVELKDLGRAAEIQVGPSKTLVMDGKGKKEDIQKRMEGIFEHIEKYGTEMMDKEQYLSRIGALNGKVAVIQVGAPTLLEMHEQTHRIQAALSFVRAAVKGGVVSGGGSALAYIGMKLSTALGSPFESEDELMGAGLMLDALFAPAKAFARMDGVGEKETLKIMSESKGSLGYDIISHNYVNMKEHGILDSLLVLKEALRQASSVTYEWLATDVLMVSSAPDKEDIELMKQGVPILR